MITVSSITLESDAATTDDYLILAVSAKVYSVLTPEIRVFFTYRGKKKYALNGRIIDFLTDYECDTVKQELEKKG